MSRHIAFDGIDNFRDFGDYAAGARRLRPGLLYRSANHSQATDQDLAKLAGLGVTTIVDLRRPNERERAPSRRWEGFSATIIDNDILEQRDDEWRDFIVSSDLSAASFTRYMMDYYEHAPFWRRHIDLYSRYFRTLAETEGAILVHCAAGKDRTGVLCALTHHLAGVSDDDIMADYLLTNDEDRLRKRLPFMRDYVLELSGKTASDEALLIGMRVESEYLQRAFEVIRARHGSLDGYLDEALGLDAATRAAIHERLLT